MSKESICVFCGGTVDEGAEQCPHCGGPLKHGAGSTMADKAQSPANGPAPRVGRCPNCSFIVGAGDIVCVQCGTNLLTGRKIVEEKKRETGKTKPVLKMFAFLLLTIVLVLAFAFLFMMVPTLFRDPVGEAGRLARAGDTAKAVELLQNHLERVPNDEDAEFLLGKIFWQTQQYERAAKAFESTARRGGSRDRDAALLALLAFERMPDTTGRQSQLALLRTLTQQRYANDRELLKLLGLTEGVEKEYRGHRQHVEESERLGGTLSPSSTGLARMLDNDLSGADSALQIARIEHPDDSTVNFLLGLVHVMRDEEEEAIAALEQVGDENADIAYLANLQQATLHLQAGRQGKALPLLNTVKASRPDDSRVAFLHALCLQENRLREEALSAFATIVDGGGPFAGLAALQMAILHSEQNTLDRAISMVRRAAELGVNTARQATVQGRIFALLDEQVQAEEAYRRAIAINSEYPAARLELGLLLLRRENIEAGLEHLETYLTLTRDNPLPYRANEVEVLVTQIKQTRQ